MFDRIRNSKLVLAYAMALLTVTGCGRHTDSDAVRATAADVQMILEATELGFAFESAEARATELYVGKRARIRGQFGKSEPLADGNFAVTFKTSRETFRPVRCVVHAADSAALNDLSSGDPITVTGMIDGFSESRYFITVEDCSIDR